MLMKNPSDTIGNRTRDLPTCCAVPQPTERQQKLFCAPRRRKEAVWGQENKVVKWLGRTTSVNPLLWKFWIQQFPNWMRNAKVENVLWDCNTIWTLVCKIKTRDFSNISCYPTPITILSPETKGSKISCCNRAHKIDVKCRTVSFTLKKTQLNCYYPLFCYVFWHDLASGTLFVYFTRR